MTYRNTRTGAVMEFITEFHSDGWELVTAKPEQPVEEPVTPDPEPEQPVEEPAEEPKKTKKKG